jgi:UDP-2-acetamido-2-deoxy-ribo-hexuluronate aminotransferase
MDTLQCAIVLAKLDRFDWEIERRLEIGARYNELCDAAGIERVVQRPDRTSVFAQYTVQVDNRDRLQDALKAQNIPTAVHYPVPLGLQPGYKHLCCPGCTPVADSLARRVMSLPMSPDLDSASQRLIVEKLDESLRAVGP